MSSCARVERLDLEHGLAFGATIEAVNRLLQSRELQLETKTQEDGQIEITLARYVLTQEEKMTAALERRWEYMYGQKNA